MIAVRPGYNRRARVVAGEVITARHRHIALLVADCYFMEMLDRRTLFFSMKNSYRSRLRNRIAARFVGSQPCRLPSGGR
jgi:hypothetical protein